MEIVYVEWVDSQTKAPMWTQASEVDPQLLQCHSVGYVLHDTDDVLVLIQTVAEFPDEEEDDLLHGIQIPKVAIVKRIPLKSAE